MSSLVSTTIAHDFGEMHQRMQWYVDQELLPCCATVVMHGRDVVDFATFGYMDRESREPLRHDAIFRMYSNTKVVTSVAAMMLWERGAFGLDDPVEDYLPEFGGMRVLAPGATSRDDTVPADRSVTPRQLLSHSAGLSYGFLELDSIIDIAYLAAGVDVVISGFHGTLADLSTRLGELPLAHQPGTAWRYSLATDVMARLVEVLSGERFDVFLESNILGPLGMHDTGFFVPPEKHERFTTMYHAADLLDPLVPGLSKADDPASGDWSQPRTFLSGGGGLVSTVSDFVAFARTLVGEGEWNGTRILSAETLQAMRTHQLAPGIEVGFPDRTLTGVGFGLGFAVLLEPGPEAPPGSAGEYGWGGMAGTSTWFAPAADLAGLFFTQRMPTGLHPVHEDFRRFAYASVSD